MQDRKKFEGKIYYQINLDSLVSDDHFLKRLEELISFDFMQDIT